MLSQRQHNDCYNGRTESNPSPSTNSTPHLAHEFEHSLMKGRGETPVVLKGGCRHRSRDRAAPRRRGLQSTLSLYGASH